MDRDPEGDSGPRPVEIPTDIFERVSALCVALPEVTVRVDPSRVKARSTAHSFDIRRRSLLSGGHPFYSARGGHDRIRVLLTEDTDWDEIGELVTESYRILAPKKLSALLDC